MTVIGKFLHPSSAEVAELVAREQAAGPANYQSGARPTVTFADLKQVTEVIAVQSDDGRPVDVVDITGNIVTYRVRGQPAALAQGAGLPEVPNATNLSGSLYTFYARGL
jgi:hypothetical protein